MVCFVPFNNRDLDISFLVLRPTVAVVDDLVEALKHFSLSTETLSCLHNAFFRSIHGNLIIWYGAWMKRSDGNKELLNANLLSLLTNVSSMALLIDHGYFEPYAGESRDGSQAAKFSIGDTVSMSSAYLSSNKKNENEISFAYLDFFKSRFLKMAGGAVAGVCLKSPLRPITVFHVWKSLHSCYSWVLFSDYRKTLLPYLDGLSLEVKYDIYRVVYVSGDNVVKNEFCPPHHMLENEVQSKEGSQVVQD